ncbi:ribosomal-protein-alanine acetyltransferase [Rhodosalinus halophilus]|uniref:Ribosomal-protein-alanine acetyltransferase n=1 Tax=Rhodosalinus halophilus TaxID=2259333 RepID=A0A365UCT9_9RHOB|nr:GNAT family N-acetyltransferase [Rhodosalinus halophilus]RBI87192.1 ribosomal-protein-alanine acetyltransferase [Rhodosalinus halophilus]
MTPETLAALHARAFARGWTAEEFARLLESPHVFALGDGRAFALGRVAAEEAELLTLATDPLHRRQGLARARLAAFEAEARARGATTAFLEVAADNGAARALYEASGWAEAGRRPRYYPRSDGPAADALIMRRALRPPAPLQRSVGEGPGRKTC